MSKSEGAKCSTPISEGKKRELSSPIDCTDIKKPKSSETHIVLSKEDIAAIADVLKDTFRPELLSVDVQVQAIVDGVLTGLNKKIHHLEHENEELRARVTKLERDADTAEQYSRRNCLRISGVPENGDENILTTDQTSVKSPTVNPEPTDGKILQIAEALNVHLTSSDIDRSHRVGKPKAGKPRDIIVKFSTYRARNMLYKSRVELKNRGYKGVFVNEDLTKMRASLFFRARQLLKDRFITGAWTYDGTVMVKDSNLSVHRIATEAELMAVKSEEPIKRKY